MKRSIKKLSLKRETVQKLDERSLGQAAGGSYYSQNCSRWPQCTPTAYCSGYDCPQ